MSIVHDHIHRFSEPALSRIGESAPWDITSRSQQIVGMLLRSMTDEFRCDGDMAVHKTAVIEEGALLRGPVIVGAGCFVASGSLVRGGCWIDDNCVIGPGVELKSSFVFRGTKLAHFNFVGDSILGENVNLEAGSVIANYRNEMDEPGIQVLLGGTLVETGVDKFGALVGDGTRIGANAVIAPGAVLSRFSVVPRLGLIDQTLAP